MHVCSMIFFLIYSFCITWVFFQMVVCNFSFNSNLIRIQVLQSFFCSKYCKVLKLFRLSSKNIYLKFSMICRKKKPSAKFKVIKRKKSSKRFFQIFSIFKNEIKGSPFKCGMLANKGGGSEMQRGVSKVIKSRETLQKNNSKNVVS